MILVITPSVRAQDCIQPIEQATGIPTQCAASAQDARSLLGGREYSAVVFDQILLDAEPEEAELLLDHLDGATPVYVNFAIQGKERVARQVWAAIQRRKAEEKSARLSAQRALKSELNETVTAMLLSCGLALSFPDLPPAAIEKLQALQNLVCELGARLEERQGPS